MKRNQRSRKKILQRNTKIQKKKKITQNTSIIITIILSIIAIALVSILIFNISKNNKILQNLNSSTGQELNISENSQSNNSNENLTTEEANQNNAESEEEEDVAETTFTMTAIGDVMCHNTQYMDAYDKQTGEYDFSYVFENISYYTKIADISIGSLETSFAGAERGYSNYPRFNTPDALAYALKDIGIDVLSTAGNHSLDMGFSGLSRTIDVLNDADIAHLGTYKTQEEQEKILYKYVKGLKIAFINYTYGTNGIPLPSDKPFCVNLINKDLIQKQIETAKSQKANIIVACMHWGTEYRTTANDEQKELADFLFKNGVDIILGNHPHVLEQMEKRTITLEDGTTREGFVIYALGNFICDQNYENTRNSIILNFKITRHKDKTITIDEAEYVPIYMYKNTNLSTKKMKVLDIEKTIENYEDGTDTSIGQKNYNYLKVQLDKIKSIVGDEIK